MAATDSVMDTVFDLFVIGGGSGGVRAARWSAGLGAKVAIAEEDRYGGTCVIRGCVPKKLMVYASQFRGHFEAASGYGWQMPFEQPVHDWSRLQTGRDAEVERLEGIYERLLNSQAVTVLKGRAVIDGPGRVRVNDTVYQAKRILIATGSRPDLPSIPGIEHCITSNEIFQLARRPARLLVQGVGYIGLEFASILRAFGSAVTVLSRGEYILREFDRESAVFLERELVKKGIQFRHSQCLVSISKEGDRLIGISGSGEQFEADQILMATGRRPNTTDLGLAELGVDCKANGAIIVNDQHETSVPGVYAVGDCTDRMNLTPIATAEATRLAENLFGQKKLSVAYEFTPSAVFTSPPLACCGYSEEQARERFENIDVYTSDFKSMQHALSGIDERFFMKLIVDRHTDRVVGAHAVGLDAAEMMQGVAIAINAGATKADFNRTIGIHPTIAEEFCTLRTPRDEH
ncbi:MAG: glutathione-disulfide reductase [Leptospiraceae bacterium]|nr:glutathione-disulfide reductase [Leptospiraceae bacterium]